MLDYVYSIHKIVPLYIDSKQTSSTNITEESSNNNRTLPQFPPWKQFVSPVETNCFHGGNIGKQTDYLILKYVIVATILRLFSMNV